MSVNTGDIVIMRHTYAKCPVMPDYLSTLDNGSYPKGGVYVLLRVTSLPEPNKPGDISQHEINRAWNHSYCGTSFERMGFIRNLKADTKLYLTAVCAPTMAIFRTTNGPSIKSDLWETATISASDIEKAGGIKNSAPRPDGPH